VVLAVRALIFSLLIDIFNAPPDLEGSYHIRSIVRLQVGAYVRVLARLYSVWQQPIDSSTRRRVVREAYFLVARWQVRYLVLQYFSTHHW
jgi:hypothetical protein